MALHLVELHVVALLELGLEALQHLAHVLHLLVNLRAHLLLLRVVELVHHLLDGQKRVLEVMDYLHAFDVSFLPLFICLLQFHVHVDVD